MTNSTQAGPFQARVSRDLVVVEGPDATSFLQSLVSQDLDAVTVGACAHSLLLQPQGKLLVDFYVVHVADDTWWCICEGGFGTELYAGLKRFKIRVKVELTEQPVSALALRGVGIPAGTGVGGRVRRGRCRGGGRRGERTCRRAACRRRRVRTGAH
jgi:folate-binding Fe-S cluster repair protein YgfZ